MKKHIFLYILLAIVGNLQAQTIDLTAMERLVQLKNLVDKAKTQIATLKNDTKQNASTKANTTALLEARTKIEDLMRNPDEYLKIGNNAALLSDAQTILKLCTSLKKSFASNLNSERGAAHWEINELSSYLDSKTFSDNSGTTFHDLLTKGVSVDNKNGVNSVSDYINSQKTFLNRQYALQTALQKKKMQQALTYYKMADELEIKAMAMNESAKSRTLGTPFQLNNQGIFSGIGDDLGGDLFGDLFNSGNILGGQTLPNFGSSGVISIDGKNYVMDTYGNVYGDDGKFVSNDIAFGAKELAIEQFKNDVNSKSLWDDLSGMFSNGGLLGLYEQIKNTPTYQKYYDAILQQRSNALNTQKSQDIQTKIMQNMMDNLYNPNKNYADNSFNTAAIGSLSGSSSGLRMGTGERIVVNKACLDLLTKAQELREKGDKLMLQALERTETQKKIDGMWATQLWRNSLAKIKL